MMKKFFLFFCLIASFLEAEDKSRFLHWGQLNPPVHARIEYVKLLNKNSGYIFSKRGFLYKFASGDWHKIPLPENVAVEWIEVTAPDEIWAIVQPRNDYRHALMRYKNGKWRFYRTPNVDDLRWFTFESPESGWAYGRWREILRFENEAWRQTRSPSPCHINKIFRTPAGKTLAVTDCQSGRSDILEWDGKEWSLLERVDFSELYFCHAFSDTSILLGDGRGLMYFNPDKRSFRLADAKFSQGVNHEFMAGSFFPDHTGYISFRDTLFYVIDFEKSVMLATDFDHADQISRLTTSPDSGAWAYTKSGDLWSLGLKDEAKYPRRLAMDILPFTLDAPFGLAILAQNDERKLLYGVASDKENTVFDNLTTSLHRERKLAYKLGLAEPQKTKTGGHIYDFGVLTADFNHDGGEDVFLSSLYGQNILLLNEGGVHWLDATNWAGFETHPDKRFCSPATADVDADGDLDIFVADEKCASVLYINDGYGRFRDEAAERGINIPRGAKSGCFGDIDGDGWIDLAVATYQEGTFLFRNLGDGRFEDIAHGNSIFNSPTPEKAASLTFADYDNDADLDLFIARLGVSNQLLRNNGAGVFTDVTARVGLTDSSLSKSGVFLDIENDGDLDLIVTNMGMDQLFLNENGFFEEAAFALSFEGRGGWAPASYSYAANGASSTGIVTVDLNEDGDMDFIIASHDYEKSHFYRNLHNQGDFLLFELKGSTSNVSALGAAVTLFPADSPGEMEKALGVRMIESTSGLGSHSEKLIHFGVDPAKRYSALVKFSGGATDTLHDLQAGQKYRIIERGAARRNVFPLDWRKFKNLLFGYRGTLRIGQALVVLAFSFLIVLVGGRFFVFSAGAKFCFVMLFIAGVLSVHKAGAFQSDFMFFTMPLLASGLFSFGFIKVWQIWRFRHTPNANLQEISLRLKTFSHSEKFANALKDIELHLENSRPGNRFALEIAQLLLEDFEKTQAIAESIRDIAAHQRTARFRVMEGERLLRSWKRVRINLSRLQKTILAEKPIPKKQRERALNALHDFWVRIASLKEAVTASLTTNVIDCLEKLRQRSQRSDFLLECRFPKELPPAYIAKSDFSTIVDELLVNAERAMKAESRKKVIVIAGYCANRRHELFIDVCDTGPGVPTALKEEIFKDGFSSKAGGGYGLAMIRNLLAQYNGKIELLDSIEQKGARFRVTLQMAKTREK